MLEPSHRSVLAGLALFLAQAAGLAAEPVPKETGRPVLAVLTQVEGDVQLAASDGSRERPARLLQAVAEGDRLELADGARVTLLCANASVHRLDQGGPLSPDLYRDAALERALVGGGLELNLGSLELIGEARGDANEVARRLVRVDLPEPEQLRRALEALGRLGLDAQTEVLTRAAIYAGAGQLDAAAAVLADR